MDFTIVYAALAGLAVALTGVGGAGLVVPLLLFGLGMAPGLAVPAALLLIALASAIGAGDGARVRLVDVRVGLLLAATGFVGAPLGVWAGTALAGPWWLPALGALLIGIGCRLAWQAARAPESSRVLRGGLLLTGDRRGPPPPPAALCAGRVLALGVAGALAGFLAGLFGVGGAFATVPILAGATRMPRRQAVATALMASSLTCLAGLVAVYGLRPPAETPWFLFGLLVVGTVVGVGLGRRLAAPLAGPWLQRSFAVLLLAAGVLAIATPWLEVA